MSSLTESPTRRRVIVVAGLFVLALCGAWIIYVIRPNDNLRINNNPTLAPEVQEAKALTAELQKDERCSHLEISKVDDQTWQCVGEVKKAADVKPAKDRVQELKSGVVWKFEIVPLN